MPAENVFGGELAQERLLPRPFWPDESNASNLKEDKIKLGKAYAEAAKLWNIQLSNEIASHRQDKDDVAELIYATRGRSKWDRDIADFLLSYIEDKPTFFQLQAASRLVTSRDRTAYQLIGSVIILANHGLIASAAYGVKRLVDEFFLAKEECLDVCILLANEMTAAPIHMPGLGHEPISQWVEYIEYCLNMARTIKNIHSESHHENWRESITESLISTANSYPAINNQRSLQASLLKVSAAREVKKSKEVSAKPRLRTIHHLACTGGTIISRCLATMPNTRVISEVNPMNRFGDKFEPTNPLLLLERSHRRLTTNEIIDEFKRQIEYIHGICEYDDIDLIIRDHSHTDFCMGGKAAMICPIRDYLSANYELDSLVTVRHPLDSYLGMLKRKWEQQFTPSTFDEYCKRYLLFLEKYEALPKIYYEDFCREPARAVKSACKILKVEYLSEFVERIQLVELTGDSGRKDETTIAPRERRPIPESVAREAVISKSYEKLLAKLGYSR